jgi:hypothetical protein
MHRLKEMVEEFISIGIYQESNKYHPTFEYFLFCNLIRTPKHLNIMNMPQQHWEYVVRSLEEFKCWYFETVIGDSPNNEKKGIIANSIEKIKEMRKIDQKDMDFFDYDNKDYLKHMEEYSKLDVIRNTDFLKTFPELEWLYK